MARRPGEPDPDTPEVTPEEASGRGSEGPPPTEEWEVPVDIHGPAAPPEEESAPAPTEEGSKPDSPADAGESPSAAEPPEKPRRDTEERIRVASADAADAAEQRAVEEIHALEEDLERVDLLDRPLLGGVGGVGAGHADPLLGVAARLLRWLCRGW